MKWSYSMHGQMRRCPRQLAYAHIVASHNAHDPIRHETYVLKQLEHLDMWRGSLVHQVLASAFLEDLRRGRPYDADRLTALAIQLADQQYRFSIAKRYREPGMTKTSAGEAYCALYAHEYEQTITSTQLAQIHMAIASCFTNLSTQTELLETLYSAHGHQSEVSLTFRMEDHTITGTLDVLCFDPMNRPIVVDWKIAASQSSDYSNQLQVYALAIERCGRWPRVRASDIKLYEANLLHNIVHDRSMSDDVADATETFIYRSLIQLDDLVDSGKYRDLDLDELPVAAAPNTCAFCNFRRLCVKQLSAAAQGKNIVIQSQLWA